MSLCTVGRTRILCSNVSFFLQWITLFCHTRIGRYKGAPAPTVNRAIAFWVTLPPYGPQIPFGLGLFCVYQGALRQNGAGTAAFLLCTTLPPPRPCDWIRAYGAWRVCHLFTRAGPPHTEGALPATVCLFFCGLPYGRGPAQKHRFARLPVLVKSNIVLHPKWPSHTQSSFLWHGTRHTPPQGVPVGISPHKCRLCFNYRFCTSLQTGHTRYAIHHPCLVLLAIFSACFGFVTGQGEN